MTPLAEVRGLTVVGSGDRRVLSAIDLELREGEVTALVGASGAGKTTLAHALLGHVARGMRREAGTVLVAGRDPFSTTGRVALRGTVTTVVPQDPRSALDPSRRVASQIRDAARIAHHGSSRRALDVLVRDAAESALLDPELLRRRPSALSGGQAQRALLARVVAARPRLLVLDEPTSALDARTASLVAEMFTSLPWSPAVLLVSHDRELVERASDRVVLLEGGCLVGTSGVVDRPPSDTARPIDVAAPIDVPRPLVPRSPLAPRVPVDVAAAHGSPTTSGARAAPDGGGATPLRTRDGRSVLEVEDLRIRRGTNLVLRSASLRVTTGECVAVSGRSGSGKTSLALALSGLVVPEAGAMRLLGHPVPWDAGARARGGAPFVAYVGQDARAALHPGEAIGRSLDRAAAAARRRVRDARDPRELLERFGLDPASWSRPADALSGGQRHRVALARAIAAGPAVLVCDESTASLDGTTAALVLDVLDSIRAATGTSVVLVTHQAEVIERADRVLVVADGALSDGSVSSRA